MLVVVGCFGIFDNLMDGRYCEIDYKYGINEDINSRIPVTTSGFSLYLLQASNVLLMLKHATVRKIP